MAAGVLSLCRKSGLRGGGRYCEATRYVSQDRRRANTICTIFGSRKGLGVRCSMVILSRGRAFSATLARLPRMAKSPLIISDSGGLAQATAVGREKVISSGNSGQPRLEIFRRGAGLERSVIAVESGRKPRERTLIAVATTTAICRSIVRSWWEDG